MARLNEEKEVVSTMIRIYCRGRHQASGGEPCRACAGLEAYSHARLESCPRGGEKSFCSFCVHPCYGPMERARIRRVMAYAGPRMFFHRPSMALSHFKKTLAKKSQGTCQR